MCPILKNDFSEKWHITLTVTPLPDLYIFQDIKSYSMIQGDAFPYPIIDDESRDLAVRFDMIDPAEKDKDGLPLTCRAVFIIDPNKVLRLYFMYPATTGRNFE